MRRNFVKVQAGLLILCMLVTMFANTSLTFATQSSSPYWQAVGSTAFSAGATYNTSIAIDRNGTPYVAYQDAANSNKVTVKKNNGTEWVTVGSAGFSAGGAYYESIAIDGNGTPYVVYTDEGFSSKVTVKKYNGTNWVTVGSEGFSAGPASFTHIVIDGSGTPYVAYTDGASSSKATVMKYNGTSWVTVGSAGFSVGRAYSLAMAMDGNGTPYVVYQDGGNSYKATVMKYTGTAWVAVGSVGFSAGMVNDASIAIDSSGTPYVAYRDHGNSYKATVMKYTGTAWVAVGSAGISPGDITFTSIATDSHGTPYIVFLDKTSSNKATVMKYNGTAWVLVGSTVASGGSASYPSIAINGNGTPYVAFSDYAGTSSGKATVMKYAEAAPTPTYTVIYNQNGGTGGTVPTDSNTYEQGSAVTVSGNTGNLVKTGYTFAGWNTAVDGSGTSYAANGSLTMGTTDVILYAQWTPVQANTTKSWQLVGSAGFSAEGVSHTTIAIDNGGTPYVVYSEGSNESIAVKKFNGTDWETVGNLGFSAGGAYYTSIVVDRAGTPYVAYQDAVNGRKVTVMKYNGSEWVTVGEAGFSAGGIVHTSIAVSSDGTPYVAYTDGGHSNKITVMKYNGTEWVAVGSAGLSAGGAYYPSLELDSNGTPYVAYMDFANSSKATVMKFGGTAWETVGNADFSAGAAANTSLAIDNNGTPYVAYQDGQISNKVTVMKFNGNAWETVGNAGLSAGIAYNTSLAIDNSGTPYVTYQDREVSNKATVMKFNGNAWETVGNAGFSAGDAYYTSIVIDSSGTPYVVYGDLINSNKATVMKYGPAPQVALPGAPVIESVVAGDGHVHFTWNAADGLTGYKIYGSRASGSYTEPISTVDGSVHSFDVTGLTNGTTYYFTVKATNPGGDSEYSNEVSATPQAASLGAPILQSAVAGDGHVTITWGGVENSTGYKVYASSTSNSYTAPVTTVTGSVYSSDVTGLSNGTNYYFAVKAIYPGGDSGYSNEVSATPKTVPGVPTNITATAGNGAATVSFAPPTDDGGSPVTGYVVTSNPGHVTATGTDTSITVTGLTNGTTYTFTVKAVNAVGSGQESAASNAATPYGHSSGGGSEGNSTPLATPTSTPITQPTPAANGVEILINGKREAIATAATTKEGEHTVITVIADDIKVEEKLQKEGNRAVVTIPVKNDADVVVGQINGQTIKNMETKEAVLEIKTGNATYTLPASQINIDSVSAQIGKQVKLKDIAVNVKISAASQETTKVVQDTADKNNYQVLVKPVEFAITCLSQNKTVEVSKFNGYVERMVAIPDGIDPSKVTTGIVLNTDGTFSHVPTNIALIGGKYYAKINSLTNSTYSVIWNPKTFTDVADHWAKDSINDMGSRLVISGVDNGRFEPNRDITRAEFATIVVRALGLLRPGTGNDAFNDVPKDAWYYDAVSIAYKYGIISGDDNGMFRPMDKISREQAMAMIARAMKVTGLKAELTTGDVQNLLAGFEDADQTAEYAKDGIASCIKVGIVSGRNATQVAPKDNITRAEVSVMIRGLLQKSKLI